jgi:hypothetical protein
MDSLAAEGLRHCSREHASSFSFLMDLLTTNP